MSVEAEGGDGELPSPDFDWIHANEDEIIVYESAQPFAWVQSDTFAAMEELR